MFPQLRGTPAGFLYNRGAICSRIGRSVTGRLCAGGAVMSVFHSSVCLCAASRGFSNSTEKRGGAWRGGVTDRKHLSFVSSDRTHQKKQGNRNPRVTNPVMDTQGQNMCVGRATHQPTSNGHWREVISLGEGSLSYKGLSPPRESFFLARNFWILIW